MRLRFLPSLAALALLPACTSTVMVDQEQRDEEECGPRPLSGGWCPPSWACIDGEWVDTAGACPQPACPESEPSPGSSCDLIGQTCSYSIEYECGPLTEQVYECTSSGWETAYNACQPEPTCPLAMPIVGSDCSGWDYPYYCQYNHACGEDLTSVTMSCDYTTEPPSWQLDSEPPVCGACESITDTAACSATSGCQWLSPGCGENAVAAACYPAGDCLFDGCDPDQVCVTFDHDPCWNALCDACSAPIGLCLWID